MHKLLTIEMTPHHQPDFLTCMNVQVNRIPFNKKHNGTESFGVTEAEILSKLPLLLNSWVLGTEKEVGGKKTTTFHHLSIFTCYGSFLTLKICGELSRSSSQNSLAKDLGSFSERYI